MKAKANLDLALEQCLLALARGESVEACLKRFPQWRAQLEPELRAAQAMREAGLIGPEPGQVERIWSSVWARIDEEHRSTVTSGRLVRYLRRDRSEDWSQPPRRFDMSAIAATVALLITLLGGGGMVYAAQDALPGQPLYQVREAIEAARVRLSASEQAQLQVRLELAEERLSEAEQAMNREGRQDASTALQAYTEQMTRAGELAQGLKGTPQEARVRETILERVNEHIALLQRLQDRLHERDEAAEGMQRAVEQAEALRERWQARNGQEEPGVQSGPEEAAPEGTPGPAQERQGPPEEQPTPSAEATPQQNREGNTERNQEQNQDGAGEQQQEQNQAGSGEQQQEQNREQERVQPEETPVPPVAPPTETPVPQTGDGQQNQNQEQHQEEATAQPEQSPSEDPSQQQGPGAPSEGGSSSGSGEQSGGSGSGGGGGS